MAPPGARSPRRAAWRCALLHQLSSVNGRSGSWRQLDRGDQRHEGATIVRSQCDDQRQFAVPDDPRRVPYLSLSPRTMSPSVVSIAVSARSACAWGKPMAFSLGSPQAFPDASALCRLPRIAPCQRRLRQSPARLRRSSR
jgi:hypothetical protein